METLPIRNPFPGAVSRLVEATGSTQGEARRLAEACGADGGGTSPGSAFPHGSLVAANAQSSGRGRFPEREWVSEPGKNLLFTLFLDPTAASALPIRIGSALCDAATLYGRSLGASFAAPPRLKWPNDLMFADRKAAGILCEAGSSGVFAGIGLNCNQLSFPPGLETKATSLALELGREVGRWALLEIFLEALAGALRDADWRRRAESLLWRKGEPAIFLPGSAASSKGREQRAMIGTVEGIDASGSLLFRERGKAKAQAHASGELRAGTYE